jgi:hypothetical protein
MPGFGRDDRSIPAFWINEREIGIHPGIGSILGICPGGAKDGEKEKEHNDPEIAPLAASPDADSHEKLAAREGGRP